jgi:hypothetical protein
MPDRRMDKRRHPTASESLRLRLIAAKTAELRGIRPVSKFHFYLAFASTSGRFESEGGIA